MFGLSPGGSISCLYSRAAGDLGILHMSLVLGCSPACPCWLSCFVTQWNKIHKIPVIPSPPGALFLHEGSKNAVNKAGFLGEKRLGFHPDFELKVTQKKNETEQRPLQVLAWAECIKRCVVFKEFLSFFLAIKLTHFIVENLENKRKSPKKKIVLILPSKNDLLFGTKPSVCSEHLSPRHRNHVFHSLLHFMSWHVVIICSCDFTFYPAGLPGVFLSHCSPPALFLGILFLSIFPLQ